MPLYIDKYTSPSINLNMPVLAVLLITLDTVHQLIISVVIMIILLGPQGFWGSGENGYLFSGSWGALVIILVELGSKLIIFGIQEALPKSKK